MADVLNTPLEYHPSGSGALGIAFLAGYAAGQLADLAILERWLREPEILQPDTRAHATYNRIYASYCEFDQALAEPFARLASSLRLPPIPS
jgi:sugar (pentulose or hexulose) kinase